MQAAEKAEEATGTLRIAMKTQPAPEAKQDSRHHTDGRWVAITRSRRALNRVVDASATKAEGSLRLLPEADTPRATSRQGNKQARRASSRRSAYNFFQRQAAGSIQTAEEAQQSNEEAIGVTGAGRIGARAEDTRGQ